MKTFTIILLLVCLALSGILFKQCSDAREGLAKIAQHKASILLLEEEKAKFDAKFLAERAAWSKEQLVADVALKRAEINLSEIFATTQEAVTSSTEEELQTEAEGIGIGQLITTFRLYPALMWKANECEKSRLKCLENDKRNEEYIKKNAEYEVQFHDENEALVTTAEEVVGAKTGRFGFGVGLGLAYTPSGRVVPVISLGMHYNLFTF